MASGEDAYRSLHWGLAGEKEIRAVGAPDPRKGKLVELGTLRAVEYETEKYGDGKSIYRHKFAREFPTLAVQWFESEKRYGGLVIVGGGYVVEWRGIVR